MITQIRLGNYGPFGTIQAIPCRPLTLVYGPNNAGKTTLFKALVRAAGLEKHGFTKYRGPFSGNEFRFSSEEQLGFLNSGFRKRWSSLEGVSPWESQFGHLGISIHCDDRDRYLFTNRDISSVGWQLATTREHHGFEEVGVAVLLVNERPAALFRSGELEQYAADHEVFAGLAGDTGCPRGTMAGIEYSLEDSIPGHWRECLEGNPAAWEGFGCEDDRPPEYRDRPVEPAVRLPGDSWLSLRWGSFLPQLDESDAPQGELRPSSPASALLRELVTAATFLTRRELMAISSFAGPARSVPEGVGWFPAADQAEGRPTPFDTKRWLGLLGVELVSEYWNKEGGDSSDKLVRWYLRDRLTGAEGGIDAFGDGVGQLFPVLEHISGRQRLTWIRQPELHLHPALQAEVGDILAEATQLHPAEVFPKPMMASPAWRNQVFVETHSEHILLRLMRRMRETSEGSLPKGTPRLTPEDLVVLYVEPRGDGSIVHELPLNARGELMKPWPGGFFEEGLREVFS